MNYADLQARIADYVHRGDLTTQIPGFIELAEAYLFRELNIKALGLSVTGTTTGEYATLPADFGSVVRMTASTSGTEYELDYASQPYSYTLSYPATYALESNKLRLFGCGTGTSYTLYYTPKIQALSVGNPTNWILENAPDLYLYSSVLETCRYTQNADEQARMAAMLPSLLDGIRRFSERRGLPSSGSLQIKVRH